jgi:hypothetical protein
MTFLKINILNCAEMVERMESREIVEVDCSGRGNFPDVKVADGPLHMCRSYSRASGVKHGRWVESTGNQVPPHCSYGFFLFLIKYSSMQL